MKSTLKEKILKPVLPLPIETQKDYTKRCISLIVYALFFIGGLIFAIIAPKENIFLIWSYWGIACMFVFLPSIAKVCFKSAKVSYKVGKNLTEREWIEINQVSETQYRATHKKSHDGDFFAMLGAIFTFLFLGILYGTACGPVFLGIKIYKTISLIQDYKKTST